MNLPGVSSISMKCSSSGTESSSGSSNSPIRHWRKGTLRGKVVIIQCTYFLVTAVLITFFSEECIHSYVVLQRLV